MISVKEAQRLILRRVGKGDTVTPQSAGTFGALGIERLKVFQSPFFWPAW